MKNLIPSRLIISTIFFLFYFAFKSFAFDYKISFTASGVKTSIDYVVVQNLTRGTTITVTGGNLLELTAVQQVLGYYETLKIYPNPIQNKATVSYFSYSSDNTQLSIIGIDGRTLTRISKKLEMGENHFELTLPKGAYTLQINDNGRIHSAKILSQSTNAVGVVFVGSDKANPQKIREIQSTSVPMQYNIGDIILFKAYSGNYISLLTDIISGDKTINFNFVECKDVDGNYYPTVTIGTQIWMAENLKTSKYRNNVTVTDKTNSTSWGTSTTGALSDYATPNYSTTYGKLYNWYAVANPNNLAPDGWHIPTDSDWTELSDFLGDLYIVGDKLKENGNSHWVTANSTATNETGFTALPGGSRSTDNTIYDIGNIGYWWSITEGAATNNAWYRSLSNQNGTLTRGYFSKSGGMSVRCLMGDFPILTTINSSSITSTGFLCSAGISFDGNYPVTSCGICWSTNQNPTIKDFKTSDWNGTGSFTSTVTGLSPQTTYYVRAYATNSYGTGYSSQITVSTSTPTVTTTSISSITSNAAIGGGTISLNQGASPVSERGICWSTNQNPTITDSKTLNGAGVGSFSSSLTGLTPETVYYVRAYATNGAGTAYGSQVSFSTKLPVLTTTAVSAITVTSAICGGNVTDIGGSAVTARGVCWGTNSSPTISNSKTTDSKGLGVYTSSITGLTIGTTYYVRAYATNSIGTAYGNEISFTTLDGKIILLTTAVTNISVYSAKSGGFILSDGGFPVTARGLCWSIYPNPTTNDIKSENGSGVGTFYQILNNLLPDKQYYIRAYAKNSNGTFYGNEFKFSTLPATGSVQDVDGNTYFYITIGSQTWMVENLKTTKYKDGTSIPNVTSDTTWSVLTTPAYCWYDNNSMYKNTYGPLYNWYAVNTKKLAPEGWHVPTNEEWTILENYVSANLGSTWSLAKALAANTNWVSYTAPGSIGNNLAENNTSGFSALPGGSCSSYGTFNDIGKKGCWWSADAYNNTNNAYYCYLVYYDSNFYRSNYSKNFGFSVRCVRD